MSANEQRFSRVVSAVLGIPADTVRDDLAPDTADTWDSLNHINLIAALEQEFGVTVAAENLANAQTVRDLKALLAEHGVAF